MESKNKNNDLDLFGDDDDSSSSEDDFQQQQPSSSTPAAATITTTTSNPESSLPLPKMEEEQEPAADAAAGSIAREAATNPAQPPTTKAPATNSSLDGINDSKQGNDDDEADDESEPEFDDQGEVVGLAKTSTTATTVTTKDSTTSLERSHRMDTDEEEDSSTKTATKQQTRLDNRILVVPKIVPYEEEESEEQTPAPQQPPLQLHMTKLPNLLGIQTEAFDENQYLASVEEDFFGQAAYNLIRWRYKENQPQNGPAQRESNTRLVEWEDGSYTLHIGNEVFQVETLDSSQAQIGFAGLNGYLYLSQSATYQNPTPPNEKEIQESSTGTVLECWGPIQSRFTVRPSSLQSEAHKSLMIGIRQKTIKKSRIAEIVTQEDPEKLKQERIQFKHDLEKAKQRTNRRTEGRRPRMSRDYLESTRNPNDYYYQEDEDDVDYDTTRIKDMKRRTMMGEVDDEDMDDFGDDDEDEESDEADGTFHRVRPGKHKKKKPLDIQKDKEDSEEDAEEELFVDANDDDDDEVVATKGGSSKKKRPHHAVFDDDDDDDESE